MVVSVSSLLMGLFRFSSSHAWFHLGRLYISRNLSISSRLLNLVAHSLSQYSNMILGNSVMSIVTLWFYLNLFSIFLSQSRQGLSILFNFSKNQLFVALIFCVVFLFSFVVFSHFLLFPFFCWLWTTCSYVSSSLRYNITWNFSFFLQ